MMACPGRDYDMSLIQELFHRNRRADSGVRASQHTDIALNEHQLALGLNRDIAAVTHRCINFSCPQPLIHTINLDLDDLELNQRCLYL
ncbi:hypothetical protein D3C86_2054190 [compost metagenome]